MSSLKGGGRAALCGSVPCPVDLLVAQVHASFFLVQKALHDLVHSPLCCHVLLRLERVAQDVSAGAGQLTDHLQVHAGPPETKDLHVVLANQAIVLMPPRRQAALPSAAELLLWGSTPGALLRASLEAKATRSYGVFAAVWAVLVLDHGCKFGIDFSGFFVHPGISSFHR